LTACASCVGRPTRGSRPVEWGRLRSSVEPPLLGELVLEEDRLSPAVSDLLYALESVGLLFDGALVVELPVPAREHVVVIDAGVIGRHVVSFRPARLGEGSGSLTSPGGDELG